MMQWGVRTTNNQWSVTFPIAFTNNCYAINVTCQINSTGANAENVHSINKTGCQIIVSNGKGYWIAVGVQQWGTLVNSSASYPVTATMTLRLLYSTDNVNGYQGAITPVTITGTGFSGSSQRTGVYLAICKAQQWGDMPSSTNRFTLPIALKTTSFKIMYRYENSSSAAWFDSHSNISARTNTYFDFVTALQREVFVVGWQQWGLAPSQHNSGYATDYINFNVSFTHPPKVVFNTCDSIGNSYGYSLVSPTKTQFGAYKGIYQVSWIAIGY